MILILKADNQLLQYQFIAIVNICTRIADTHIFALSKTVCFRGNDFPIVKHTCRAL
jgi:hypothetical protein